MANRSMADAVRAILVKRAFVPGDPSAGGMPPGGMPPPGMDPTAGGMPPPGMDPTAGGMPPGGLPPGGDPSMMGGDPMAGLPPVGPDPMAAGGMPQTGMINMTADEFTKFIKQMMAAFGANGAPAQQQAQPDISAKLDTLIAVIQGKAAQPAAAPAVVAGA